MLLVLGPITFLAAIIALWGRELPASLARALRGPGGKIVFVGLALAVTLEGAWVLRKVEAARAVTTWAREIHDDGVLPGDYTRGTEAAPNFSLVDQQGQDVSLGALKGRPVVVTFVFAHCETVCPLVVETLKQATHGGPRATVLLVTLDPWRDTPSTLAGIARRWSVPDGFHVLSSRRVDDVLHTAGRYGVAFARDERTGDIVHAALVFLIDAHGRLAYTFSNPSAAWVREGLRRLGPANVLAG
jgi:cytochrome oxidase Cu insertion factor (SCO1/SenC/PrrC family)